MVSSRGLLHQHESCWSAEPARGRSVSPTRRVSTRSPPCSRSPEVKSPVGAVGQARQSQGCLAAAAAPNRPSHSTRGSAPPVDVTPFPAFCRTDLILCVPSCPTPRPNPEPVTHSSNSLRPQVRLQQLPAVHSGRCKPRTRTRLISKTRREPPKTVLAVMGSWAAWASQGHHSVLHVLDRWLPSLETGQATCGSVQEPGLRWEERDTARLLGYIRVGLGVCTVPTMLAESPPMMLSLLKTS